MESERRKFGMVLEFAVLFATLVFVSVGRAKLPADSISSSERPHFRKLSIRLISPAKYGREKRKNVPLFADIG